MDKIKEFLSKIGKDEEWLLSILQKYIIKQEKQREYMRRYYGENKNKLDKYHQEYRRKTPSYRNKAKQRTKDVQRKRSKI